MIIYLIRHPETEFNKKGITQGHLDSTLTNNGKETAKKLGNLLKDKKISKIYSSDLGRCMQTSEIINEKLKIISKKELREQNFGKFNGKKSEEIEKKFNLSNLDLILPEGESFNQMKKRVINFIKKLKEEHILIVTHEGCLRAIFSEILNIDANSSKCNTQSDKFYTIRIINNNIIIT